MNDFLNNSREGGTLGMVSLSIFLLQNVPWTTVGSTGITLSCGEDRFYKKHFREIAIMKIRD